MSKAEREIDDEVLGRWLSGDLTPEELKAFEESEAFRTYKAIADYTDQLDAPEYDTSSEYEKLKAAIDRKKDAKVIPITRNRFIGIAAGIAVILGVSLTLLFWSGENLTTVETAQGETKSIQLPDQSEVALNISSSLEYNEENWEKEREVNLKGEAYFKVSEGNRFLINTDQGTVEVLGTEFNVRNRNTITEVVCYEGKVKVTDLKGEFKILTVGDVARIENGQLTSDWSPPVSEDAEWKNGFSTFHKTPFADVIEELENQYKVKVDCKADISERIYVGAFPHDNLEKALRLVFEPMQIEYSVQGDSLIIAH